MRLKRSVNGLGERKKGAVPHGRFFPSARLRIVLIWLEKLTKYRPTRGSGTSQTGGPGPNDDSRGALHYCQRRGWEYALMITCQLVTALGERKEEVRVMNQFSTTQLKPRERLERVTGPVGVRGKQSSVLKQKQLDRKST